MFSYLIFILPAFLFALYAQFKVKSAYAKASKIVPYSQLSGAEAARRILQANGLDTVEVEITQGYLGDHYDPKEKMLRLSPDVYNGRSLAAVGIAAHEAGHAIQDKQQYAPLVFRNGIVPLASAGSSMAFILIALGALIHSAGFILLGVIGYALVVVFQLVNLPVEFNASSRAKTILQERGIISSGEVAVVDNVLSAAAMTYVAATASAILTLLYYLMQLGGFSSRD